MQNKNQARLRRARSTRSRIRKLAVPRLSVHRSDQHIYAQVFAASGDRVLASASTLEKTVREGLAGTKNIAAAEVVGKTVAERALAAGVDSVAFDRSGYRFHGRVKALADAARGAGLKF
jgi:large subunit ribosomal protein L18